MSDRIKELSDRVDAIKQWPKRLEKLRTRKKNPMAECAFCEKYGFPLSWFNRVKNLHSVPRRDGFNKIEAAFKAERV